MSGLVNRTVMWLTWRQLFARRRIWFAAAFALAPLLFTCVFKLVADDGEGSRVSFFTSLAAEIVIGTLLPLAGVVFGTAAFGGEVDDGTLVYLLVKPIPRWQVVLSKFVVAALSAFAVVAPAILLPWLLLRGPDLPPRMALSYVEAAGIGAAMYTALCLWLGLVSKRALVIGLLYVIGFEGILTRSLTGLRSLSVREYTVAISQAVSGGTIVSPGAISMGTVRIAGTIITVGAIGWTIWRLGRYELREKL